jgi:acetylornithine deacetylase/succinyl-diaminopimelate desuccinylase-like protein
MYFLKLEVSNSPDCRNCLPDVTVTTKAIFGPSRRWLHRAGGGKTILPHRAVTKIDMRLVLDMKAADALAALKAHLAKRGFGDIEVNMAGE